MATATSIPRRITVHVGNLVIERKQLLFLHSRCVETDLTFHKFLAGLIDKELCEFHAFLQLLIDREQNECLKSGWRSSPRKPPIAPKGDSDEEAVGETEGRRRDTQTAETKCRIIAFLLAGGKVPACATRFGTSESSIRRTWKACGPSPETIQRILFLATRTYDEEGSSIGGVSAIAERSGVAQIIVEAILKNYQPVIPPGRGPKPAWATGGTNGKTT